MIAQKKRVFKIRLNPEDAKYGLDTKLNRDIRLKQTGSAFSYQALSAWKAAVQNTAQTILQSLPEATQKAIAKVRQTLPQKRPDACCSRCQGKGYREDKEHWIVIQGNQFQGKICFKCNGSGIEPSMEPVFFRRRAIDTILTKSPEQTKAWANKVLQTPNNPYRCVLLEIAQAVLNGRNILKLPH